MKRHPGRWFPSFMLALAAFRVGAVPGPLPRPGRDAVASAHRLATAAGLEVMRKGGNAFDAAIAVASTLGLVEPQSSGLGGGFFMLIHRARDGREVMIDARETAPAAVTEAMYRKPDGTLDSRASLEGPTSAGIPGEPAGLVWVNRHYGRLSLARDLEPAIRLARQGFQPDARFLGNLTERRALVARFPGSAGLLLPGGRVPEAGWTLRNPDYAATLERLAREGTDGFYRGALARRMVSAMRAAGGDWTLADLQAYRVRERAPVRFHYRGFRLVTAPPPSSGGVALAEMFHMLRRDDLAALPEPERDHLILEAMRRAFRDHNAYLGDPDFVAMPLGRLLSTRYADGLRASFLPDRATPSSALPKAPTRDPGRHTTHFSIIDKAGNLVACTSTVNDLFGSGFVVPGTGFLMNDEMDDFALVPDQPNVYGLLGSQANAPAPGKRMLSSMTPSFVIGKGRALVIGSPGGSTIITQVFGGILAFMQGGSAAQIVATPRFHLQYLPDVVFAEPGALPPQTTAALERMGYTVQIRPPWGKVPQFWGFMNAVVWDLKADTLEAASDPRGTSGSGRVE